MQLGRRGQVPRKSSKREERQRTLAWHNYFVLVAFVLLLAGVSAFRALQLHNFDLNTVLAAPALPSFGAEGKPTLWWPGFVNSSHWVDQRGQPTTPAGSWKRCPKVYIYYIPTDFSDLELDGLTVEQVFGAPLEGLVPGGRDTYQYAMATILTWRLFRSSCRTLDETEADLFYIPFLVRPKHIFSWQQPCESKLQGQLAELLRHLPFLNEATAHRHFLGVGMNWPQIREWCLKRDPKYPPAEQAAVKLFRSVPFVNIEVAFHDWQREDFPLLASEHHFPTFLCTADACEAPIVNMPRPASVHWNRELIESEIPMPWKQHDDMEPRDILVSLIGKLDHGDKEARVALQPWCAKYSDYRELMYCDFYRGQMQTLGIKSRSVFCLDPVGDTPGRKSTADSYACGCIPVFVGVTQAFQFPAHWDGWHDSAFLVIDEPLLLAGKLDPVELLQKVPKEAIAYIQSQIAQYGSRFIYNEEDLPEVEDSVDVLLNSLWAAASASKK